MSEEEIKPGAEETTETVTPVVEETPAPARTNMWHIVLIIAALIPLNYAIFVSLKGSFKSADSTAANTENIDNLLSAAKDNPTYETYLNLGVAYYNAKQYTDAITAWQSALKFNPNSEVIYSNLGAACGCLSQWKEQKMYCEKALAINPNFALAKNNLAWAVSELAKSDPAAANTPPPNALSAKATADFNAILAEGLNYYNQKDFNKAIATWQKALQINPNSEVIYSNMGAAYGCLSKWHEQVNCCEKALAINPNFALAQNNLAWGKSELKKLGQ